jgi:putative acetyltransferase
MPSTASKFGLRPMLPGDVPALRDIFSASVEDLTGDDYSVEQQDAWLTAVSDEAAFAERLAAELVLVATLEGAPVGFASLRGTNEIDFLYVHPAVARQGAATRLLDALEKLAGARGATELTTDASDTAREFFDARGYVARHRNTVLLGDEWLSNTTMTKQLVGDDGTEVIAGIGGKSHDH